MDLDMANLDTKQLKQLRAKIDAALDGSPDQLESLDDAIGELKTMKTRIATIGKKAVMDAIKSYFAKHAEVQAVQWRQFTPYFNDGDACVFSIMGATVLLSDANEDDGDYGDGFIDSWSWKYQAEKAKKPTPPAALDLEKIDTLLKQGQDAMLATFGDHVMVTIRRGSDQAEVEAYSHD